MAPLTRETGTETPVHIFGFVQGDVTGLLLSVTSNNTMAELTEQLLQASEIRVNHSGEYQIKYKGYSLSPDLKLEDTRIRNFERIDLIKRQDSNV